jgi:hypothetical protein
VARLERVRLATGSARGCEFACRSARKSRVRSQKPEARGRKGRTQNVGDKESRAGKGRPCRSRTAPF